MRLTDGEPYMPVLQVICGELRPDLTTFEVVSTVPRASVPRDEWTLRQDLMDLLWRQGVRPSESVATLFEEPVGDCWQRLADSVTGARYPYDHADRLRALIR